MEKALVEIFLPAANASYDVYVPLTVKMHEVLLLVSSVITDLAGGKFKATDDSVLCERDCGRILDINSSVVELGIQNGSQLMLI